MTHSAAHESLIYGNYLKPCKCGCRTMIWHKSKAYHINEYVLGHKLKGGCNYWKMKKRVKIRTSRERAMKILRKLGRTKCDINNDYCLGMIDSHHIDGNPFNNDIDNLAALCRSHHRLADLYKIPIQELKYFRPKYIVSSGKRRYRY